MDAQGFEKAVPHAGLIDDVERTRERALVTPISGGYVRGLRLFDAQHVIDRRCEGEACALGSLCFVRATQQDE